MNKLFNQLAEFEIPSEQQINEDTRRKKISQALQAKFQYDDDYALAQKQRLTNAVICKQIYTKDPADIQLLADIVRDWWLVTRSRPIGYDAEVCSKHGFSRSFLHGLIKENQYLGVELIPAAEYQAMRQAYEIAWPDLRSIQNLVIAKNKNYQQIGKKISRIRNGLTADQAQEIYNMCLDPANPDARRERRFRELGKQYGVSAGKIQQTALGNHPALADRNFETDYQAWKIATEGTYYFISPDNKRYDFNTLHEVGKWIYKTEHNIELSDTDAWYRGRMWFETIKRGEQLIKQRRFWKGWSYGRT